MQNSKSSYASPARRQEPDDAGDGGEAEGSLGAGKSDF